jgi:hypothetical protein
MGVPSREELYAEVDRLFRAEFPDAPAQLSRSRPDHEWYRDAWIAMRDTVLNSVIDEIFFDGAPGAPYPLDPDNRDHQTYIDEWREIRRKVMNNEPLPPIGDIDDDDRVVDMAWVRTGIEESLAEILPEVPEEFHEQIRAFGDTAPDKVYDAFLLKEISTSSDWHSEPLTVYRDDGPGFRVYIAAWWDPALDLALNGKLVIYQ